MIICSTNKIGKIYGANTIFENITVEIKAGDRIGLVGHNGSGKTTLIRLLAGTVKPDLGQIHWKKGLEIGYLEQTPSFEGTATVKKILMTAFSNLVNMDKEMKQLEKKMSEETNAGKLESLMEKYGLLQDQFSINGGYQMEAEIERVTNGLQMIDLLHQPFSTLSGGEKTKVGLAHILLRNPDLLLLDEPTNHLDLLAIEWLGPFLQQYKGTLVVISHDRYFLDDVVNQIVDLENGEVRCYHTNFSGFVKEKQAWLLREFQAYEDQQKKIKKMKEAIKRLKEWANQANPPNEGLHKRAKNMERALERMTKRKRPIRTKKKMNLEIESTSRSGKDVILLKDVAKGYGDTLLFQGVHMDVKYKQRVAIIGANGTGKSTLLQLVLGRMLPEKGKVNIGSNVQIGYLSQHVFQDAKDETVLEAFCSYVQVDEGEARNRLARFLFFGHMVFRKVSQLSGGEKMRLRLAQLMYQKINLLILDEPTNHLDIESREVMEEALEDFQGTILAVSHDRYFLNKLFETIYWIDAKTVYRFEGNYDWAKEKMPETMSQTVEVSTQSKNEQKFVREQKTPPRNNVKIELEKELQKLEEKIHQQDIELARTKDLAMLQRVYQEKEQLEMQWEQVFYQLSQNE